MNSILQNNLELTLDDGIPTKSFADVCQLNFKHASAYTQCLPHLLEALHWPGNANNLAESLPHLTETLDLQSLKIVMATLHYTCEELTLRKQPLDERLASCLLVTAQNKPLIILSIKQQKYLCYDPEINKEITLDSSFLDSTVYLFAQNEAKTKRATPDYWLHKLQQHFSPLIAKMCGTSVLLNMLFLATPLFIKSIYDKIIPTESSTMLISFLAGLFIAFLGIYFLQLIRTQILLYIGAHLDTEIGNKIFERLLYLPSHFTENASVGSQVARIKDFDSTREFLIGPALSLAFELPFIFIFIIVIALIAGKLALIPLFAIVVFAILSLLFLPWVKSSVLESARSSSKRQEFLTEALHNVRSLKYMAAEKTWMHRHQHLSANTALTNFKASALNSFINIIADVLMIVAGISTLLLGVSMVLTNTLSIGALIASMMLIWRVLSPLKMAFSTITKLTQIKGSILQYKTLMNLTPEFDPRKIIEPVKDLGNSIEYYRVSLRYKPELAPVLIALNLKVASGETVAIVGGNGSGKSTILKLLLGLHQAQIGSIFIDNMDIRQMNPIERRRRIAYVPQNIQLFYGTIAQNLKLTNPLANEKELVHACQLAGLYEDIMALPRQFETQIGDQAHCSLPSSFQQRLCLARAYITNAPILLLDEPGNTLDHDGDQCLISTINSLKGEKTIIMMTHRPSHFRIADNIYILNEGQLRHCDSADTAMKFIQQG